MLKQYPTLRHGHIVHLNVLKTLSNLFINFVFFSFAAWNTEYTIHNSVQKSHYNFREEDIVMLGHERSRRQAPAEVPPTAATAAAAAPATLATASATAASLPPALAAAAVPAGAATDAPATDADKNKTTNRTGQAALCIFSFLPFQCTKELLT